MNYLDQDRDRFKTCVGLPVRESPAATSFCETFLRNNDDVIVVEDTTVTPASTHSLVQGDPHVRFYAAARLVDGEHKWAPLCAYDLQPRSITVEQVAQLKTLACQ